MKPTNPISNRSRAVNIVKSWLVAAGIPIHPTKTDGMDFNVLTREKQELAVRVVGSDEASTSTPGNVCVPAAWINERRVADALVGFHLITELAGYGRPDPVGRGDQPAKRANFSDRFEEVAIKHGAFRRAPNPAPEHLQRYERTIKSACWCFLRANADLCRNHMLDIDDLISYAMCWTVVFIARDEIASPPAESDNDKLLHAHLKQRFIDFNATLRHKGKNILVPVDTALIAQFGVDRSSLAFADTDGMAPKSRSMRVVPHYNPFEETDLDSDGQPLVDEAYVGRHSQLGKKRGVLARRKAATQLLNQKLAEMPHDDMVSALRLVADDGYNQHPDAREEARSRLRHHLESCSTCQSSPKEDEHSPPPNAFGASESL